MRKWHKRLLLSTASLVACLGVAELAFRAFLWSQYEGELEEYEQNAHPLLQVVRDDPVQFALVPNKRTAMTIPAEGDRPEYTWTVTVTDGFRGGIHVDLSPEELRILVLGDSYPFGYAINDDETLPVHLEKLLNDEDSRHRIRVANGGVPGTNSVQHYHMLRRFHDRVRPHIVILTYVMNDAEPLYLVPKPPSYVYRHYTFWTLAELRDIANRVTGSKLFNVTKPVETQDYLLGFRPDSINWRESREAIKQIRDFCKSKNILFGVFVYPDFTAPFTTNYRYELIHARVKQWGREDGYPVVDLLPTFFGKRNLDFQVPGDGHPNARAQEIVATEIARYVKLALPLVK